MFQSVAYTDQIRIPPADLARGAEVVAEAIDMKFANRVLPHTGLVLGLYAVDSVRDSFIHPGDGGLHANAAFRLVVFSPPPGTLLTGRVKAQDKGFGIKVSLEFFEDVYVSPALMRPGFSWNEAKRAWQWTTQSGGEEGGEGSDGGDVIVLPVETGSSIRLHASSTVFPDRTSLARASRQLQGVAAAAAAATQAPASSGGAATKLQQAAAAASAAGQAAAAASGGGSAALPSYANAPPNGVLNAAHARRAAEPRMYVVCGGQDSDGAHPPPWPPATAPLPHLADQALHRPAPVGRGFGLPQGTGIHGGAGLRLSTVSLGARSRRGGLRGRDAAAAAPVTSTAASLAAWRDDEVAALGGGGPPDATAAAFASSIQPLLEALVAHGAAAAAAVAAAAGAATASAGSVAGSGGAAAAVAAAAAASASVPPMLVLGSLARDGTGPLSWWEGEQPETTEV